LYLGATKLNEYVNFLAQKRKKILLQENAPNSSKNGPFDDSYYKEISLLAGVGGYYIDFNNKTSYIDPQGKVILEIPYSEYSPSLSDLLKFHAPEERDRTIETFNDCAQGTSFTKQVKMVTYTGKEFWAKAIGKPIYDGDNNVVGMQGLFQNITEEKNRELKLRESLEIIANQNARLFNYANLVSHNLKSHANNINLSLELLSDTQDAIEATELLGVLNEISAELCKTVNDLCDIVSIKETAKIEKKQISLEDVMTNVTQHIGSKLREHDIQLYTDFSEAPTVYYLQSYLEDIIEALLLRAIKNIHPERIPSINIFSLDTNGKTSLLIKDNGVGFKSLEEKEQIFNLQNTQSEDSESQNLELFKIKDKISALGGTISLESTAERGTTFTIVF
jgi:signal transduction histidine kinase